MSPFTEAADRVAESLRGLGLRNQVAVYVGAARALAPGYRAWRDLTGSASPDDSRLFDSATHLATVFAVEGAAPPPELLDRLEMSTPSEPTDVPGFTTAQDCWICLDTALRAAVSDYDPADSAWYLLEPAFQAVSERLYGDTDVGSENQQAAESAALRDPALQRVLASVEESISIAAQNPTEALIASITAALSPINPS